MGWEEVQWLAARLDAQRIEAERNLLSCLVTSPQEGMEYASKCGVDRDWFIELDYQLIYFACVVAGHRGTMAVLKLARRALKEEGRWEDTSMYQLPIGPVERHTKWCDEALVWLAHARDNAWYVPALCEKVLRIRTRQRHARRCYAEMCGWLYDGYPDYRLPYEDPVVRVQQYLLDRYLKESCNG